MLRSTGDNTSYQSTNSSEDDVVTVPSNASIPWGNAAAAAAPATSPATDGSLSLAIDQAQKQSSVSMSGMRWTKQVAGDTTSEASGGEDVYTILDSEHRASRSNTNQKHQKEIFQPPMSVEISEGKQAGKTGNLSGPLFLTESKINQSVARGSFMAAGAAQSVVGGRKSVDGSTVSSYADYTKNNSSIDTNKSIYSASPSLSFGTEDSNNNNDVEEEQYRDPNRASDNRSKYKTLALSLLLLLFLSGVGFGVGACFSLGHCGSSDSSSTATATSSSNSENKVGAEEDGKKDDTSTNDTPVPTTPLPSASPSTSVQAMSANSPTLLPTGARTDTEVPTAAPTISPTALPTDAPSQSPTTQPSTSNPTPFPTQNATLPPTSTPLLDTIRINIGATTPLTDAQGLQWQSDNFEIGKAYKSDACFNPATASVYCTNKWFTNENSNGMVGSYRIGVPVELPGNYRVRLHFAELFHNSAGKRIFDVRVEGALVVDDLDVFARVDKSPYVVETDPLPCLDGTLSIELVSQTENPILNAVEVIYDSPFQLKLETLEDLHKAVDDYLDGKLLIPINSLDVGALTNFSEAFSADRNPKAATFNENLDRWNMSNAESLWSFFKGAEAFNGDISTWNTARVTNMAFMFDRAASFRGQIWRWDTSSCRIMDGAFRYAESFNSPITFWNVSSVETFSRMFLHAKVFNQVLLWDVSSGKSFNRMFEGASSFNQNLCSFGDQLRDATNRSVLRANLDLTSLFANTSCPLTESPSSPEGPWCQPCA